MTETELPHIKPTLEPMRWKSRVKPFLEKIMSRVCELTGKAVMSGNIVSHAVNKTRRKFLPNLQQVSLPSEKLGKALKFRISAHALRTVEHVGGIDAFLMKAKDAQLSPRAKKLKKQIALLLTAS